MTFSAIILAGGQSRRMGRDKAWIVFNGQPLVRHSLAIVREAGASEVLISARAGQDFSGVGCPVLRDVATDCGPLGGIERALSEASHPLVLVLAVDMPHMTPACLRWMRGRTRAAIPTLHSGKLPEADPDAKHNRMGVVPVLRGTPEPLAAIYPRRSRELLRHLLDRNQRVARDFAQACLQHGLASAAPVPAEYVSCFTNWNTAADVT